MKPGSNDKLAYANSLIVKASFILILFISLLALRAWFLQIYRGDYYTKLSENNRIRRIDIPAPRGLIYDRYGKLILGNKRMYDLLYIPQYVQNEEETLKALSKLLHRDPSSFAKIIKRHRGEPKFIPILLKQNLSIHERSLIESNKDKLSGIDIRGVSKRKYQPDLPVHLIGYLSEHRGDSQEEDYTYLPGDLSGKQGLERVWEKELRGERGFRYTQVDALGREVNSEDNLVRFSLPEIKAIPGNEIHLTIDWDLQQAALKAFRGKNGAVIVMNPQNGQILALLSAPSYDPQIFQDGLSVDQWESLLNDPFKPLFDKTTGGLFSPGSVYKPLIGLAALEEGIISSKNTHHCSGLIKLGSRKFHCHNRWGHGSVNLTKAMLSSCDVFFYQLGIDLGIDRMEKYARDFYLGEKLDFNLNKEYAGLVPSAKWKREVQGGSVTAGDLANLAIGQGALLMTPLHMASFFSTIANMGYVWRPYVVDHLSDKHGNITLQNKPELLHEVAFVKKVNFKLIKEALYEVVENVQGTGHKAHLPGIPVAGKTGSVQVVSLEKNRSRAKSTVSMKWQEHSMFASFSPLEEPEVVVIIVSEHDSEGGGGAQSAPIARSILEAYWNGKKMRLDNNE